MKKLMESIRNAFAMGKQIRQQDREKKLARIERHQQAVRDHEQQLLYRGQAPAEQATAALEESRKMVALPSAFIIGGFLTGIAIFVFAPQHPMETAWTCYMIGLTSGYVSRWMEKNGFAWWVKKDAE